MPVVPDANVDSVEGGLSEDLPAPPDTVEFAVASMRMLNRTAAEVLGSIRDVHACTDITGFGLIGHASEMAVASGVTLSIDAASVPVLKGVLEITARNRSGGMGSNRAHFGAGVEFDDKVPPEMQDIFFDPQTSGGLLFAVAADAANATLEALRQHGVAAARIGQVLPASSARLLVR